MLRLKDLKEGWEVTPRSSRQARCAVRKERPTPESKLVEGRKKSWEFRNGNCWYTPRQFSQEWQIQDLGHTELGRVYGE